jgi:hypothetical protein
MSHTKVICISGKAGHGKDAAGKFIKSCLEEQGKTVVIAHYADLVKYICKKFFHWNGEKDEYGRSLLQEVGTDTIREENPNYWVDFVIDIIKRFKHKWDFVLIPDCRFPNEATQMQKYFPTYVIRVVRPNYKTKLTQEQQQHASETAMDNFNYDYIISNDKPLEQLEEVVKPYVDQLL